MQKNAPAELPATAMQLIGSLCAEGDALVAAGRFEEAVARFNEALQFVPEPKSDWCAATWIFAAIGDACFLGGLNAFAREALENAMKCPDAVGNAFLHLRLGQVLLDAGEVDAAADNLMRAYIGAGTEAFANEDAWYLEFLRMRATI